LDVVRRLGFAVVLAFAVLTGCGMLAGPEAPESCGFPDGTALSYAGRSSTAALDVQEVVGDPMSNDAADIYITRDMFDQGQLNGRLVCAVFVDQPGFVEVTVHPADVGRFEPAESADVTPVPAPTGGVSRDEALQAAHDAFPEAENWEVAVGAGQVAQMVPGWDSYDWLRGLDPGHWVWQVFLSHGDRGAVVVIDFIDGSVYGVVELILD
jgi:hypothetical protein